MNKKQLEPIEKLASQAKTLAEELREELQEKFDEGSDKWQESDAGEQMQTDIATLEEMVENLDNVMSACS